MRVGVGAYCVSVSVQLQSIGCKRLTLHLYLARSSILGVHDTVQCTPSYSVSVSLWPVMMSDEMETTFNLQKMFSIKKTCYKKKERKRKK